MNCKYCGMQLEDGVTICPACNKENLEQPYEIEEILPEEETAQEDLVQLNEDPAEEIIEEMLFRKEKPKVWKIVLAVVCGVVLLGVLAGAVLYGLGFDFKPRENDVFYKESYMISPEKADKVASDVIATAGGKELTNAQLQVYYNMTVNDFVNYYGYYLSSIGLDTTKPFDEQECTLQEGMTWQQYFLDNALTVWHRYTILNLLAQQDGVVLDSVLREQLDQLQDQLASWAQQYGFTDAQAMLEADFGPICTLDAYHAYMNDYYLAMQYQEEKYVSLEPSADDVAVYFTENEATFAQNGITKDSGAYYDVRHILIAPEGGTTDASGQTTYTDEEWAACLIKAEEVLELWKTGEATENSFATLAAQYSTDGGSSSNGGLYSQLTSETNFVEEFKQWYLDESRQIGDTGIVQSVYGYHIMYFSGSEEIWFYNAKTTLLSEKWNQLIDMGAQQWPIEVTYKKIALCDRAEEETETETTTPTQSATAEATAAATE